MLKRAEAVPQKATHDIMCQSASYRKQTKS